MSWRMPENTEWAIKQNLHKPTVEYGREIFELVNKLKPDYKDALEIGAAWGVSTLAILMAGKGKLVSIDKDPTVKAPSEVKANKYEYRWQFYNISSEEFWNNNQKTYDLIYIDGSHKYPTCRDDFINGYNRLEKNGLFICDDFKDHRNQRVDKDGSTVEYGTSLGLWELIEKFNITEIGTTTRLFWTIKK